MVKNHLWDRDLIKSNCKKSTVEFKVWFNIECKNIFMQCTALRKHLSVKPMRRFQFREHKYWRWEQWKKVVAWWVGSEEKWPVTPTRQSCRGTGATTFFGGHLALWLLWIFISLSYLKWIMSNLWTNIFWKLRQGLYIHFGALADPQSHINET